MMRRFTITAGLLAGLCLPAAAQERDVDDPVPYERSARDYTNSNRFFGAPYYPHVEDRGSPMAGRYNNRGEMRYAPGDRRSRYVQNYGFPVAARQPALDRYGRPVRAAFDDPDPFDYAYSESHRPHYIGRDASNFRGGRYATDYPGFRGGWYGRGHRVRIRAGEYTADAFANAFREHPHHMRGWVGQHNWNWISGQAY